MSYTITPEQFKQWRKEVGHNMDDEKTFTPTIEQIKKWRQPSQRFSTLHNLGASFVDPYIELLNRGARGVGLGAHQIPTIPYNKGVASTVGDIGSFIVPVAGEDLAIMRGLGKVAELAPKAMAALKGSKAARIAGRLARGAAEGASTSAAMRPQNQSAESAAIAGGLGGIAGEGIGGALAHTVNPLFRTARFQNFMNAFLKGKLDKTAAGAQRDAVNDVANHYLANRKASNALYDQVFNNLAPKNKVMEMKDLPETTKFMATDTQAPPKLLADIPTTENRWIDPEKIHQKQSQFGRESKIADKRGDFDSRDRRDAYQNALQQDLRGFLSKNGQLENYERAQQNWRQSVHPYLESRVFKPILDNLAPSHNISHTLPGHNLTPDEIASFNVMKSSAPITKISRKFLPAGDEATDNALNEFTNLLGGDRENAIQHARHLFFSKHVDGKNFDMKGLARDLKKLKDENREALIRPEEEAQLEEMERLGKMELTPGKKRLLSMLAMGLGGHHLFGGVEPTTAAGIAGLIAEPYLEPAAAALLGSDPMRATESVLRRNLPIRYAGAPIGAHRGRKTPSYEVPEL